MNHKIKITPRDETNRSFIIKIDELDMSGIIQTLDISLVAGEMPHVTLELVPMEIEIPTELEAAITIIRDNAMDDE